jgi:glycosyltransferase involved in cell wall biosynthesis
MIVEAPPSFSIIIPVYNGDGVIGHCIESVLSQNYHSYELIIINDGSIDQTQNICQNYSDSDSRIKLFKQVNRGVSATRNYGISVAKNEYILFVDADDELSPNYLHKFAELIMVQGFNNKTLIIQDFVAKIQFKGDRKESYKWCKFLPGTYNLPEMFRELKSMNWLNWGVPFAKLYCLSIIKRHNILFDERMSFREDLIFMLDYLNFVDEIIFDSTANYQYVIDNNKLSLSNTTASFDNEFIFFNYMQKAEAVYVNKFQLGVKEFSVLHGVVYSSFFRCVNSCLYNHKVPIEKQERISKLRLLATKENIQGLSKSNVIDSKIKFFAFLLLKNKLYSLYDTLNVLRYSLV